MNIILLEDSSVPINSFLDKVYEKYPISCRLYLNNKNFKESAHYLKERPVLLNNYLVILADKISDKQLVEAMRSNNLVILKLRSKDSVTEYSLALKAEKIDFKFVDNTEKKDIDVINYVIEELPITQKDAKYLCNRHAIRSNKVTSSTYGTFNVRAVINSVNVLSVFEKIDRKTIQKYTSRKLEGSLNNVVDSLLGISRAPKSSAIKVIERYRYGLDFLLEFVNKELNKYLLLYKYIEEGELSPDNYKEFVPTDEDTALKRVSEYQLNKIIMAHTKVSWEMVYFTKVSVSRIKPRATDIFELVLLLKEEVITDDK